MFDRSKKNSGDTPGDTTHSSTGYAPPAPLAEVALRAPSAAPAPGSRGRTGTLLGPSLQIEGILKGQEDVFVEGEVVGTIQLQNHTLTIGSQGKIKADVYAHTVFVEGVMDGDLFASEQVIVRTSATLRGNITAPRVSLEDGATFKGSIEMDPESVRSVLGAPTAGNRSPVAVPPRPADPSPRPATPSSPSVGSVGGQSR